MVGRTGSSVQCTFSLSCSLDIQVVILNRQWGTCLEAKNEFRGRRNKSECKLCIDGFKAVGLHEITHRMWGENIKGIVLGSSRTYGWEGDGEAIAKELIPDPFRLFIARNQEWRVAPGAKQSPLLTAAA